MSEKPMLESLYEAVFTRKSVRKYAGAPLQQGVLDEVARVANATVAIGEALPVAFKILEASQIKGMASAKSPQYLAVYAEPGLESRTNAAFRLQQMDLWFNANGYGSCWLGMPNAAQEVASHGDLPFVIMLAFGTPDESTKRNSPAGFKRKTLVEVTTLKDANELVEPLRLAPSASNRQPWLVTGDANTLRLNIKIDGFFGKMMFKQMRFSDAGIALCHLWLAAQKTGAFAGFGREIAPSDTPKGYEYIYSVKLQRK